MEKFSKYLKMPEQYYTEILEKDFVLFFFQIPERDLNNPGWFLSTSNGPWTQHSAALPEKHDSDKLWNQHLKTWFNVAINTYEKCYYYNNAINTPETWYCYILQSISEKHVANILCNQHLKNMILIQIAINSRSRSTTLELKRYHRRNHLKIDNHI